MHLANNKSRKKVDSSFCRNGLWCFWMKLFWAKWDCSGTFPNAEKDRVSGKQERETWDE